MLSPQTADPGYLDLVVSSVSVSQWVGGNGAGGANYSNSANWSPAVVPAGTGQQAVFGVAGTIKTTVNLNANETVGVISFTGSAGLSMTLSGSNSLTLDNGTGNASILASGTQTLSARRSSTALRRSWSGAPAICSPGAAT